MLFLRKKRKEGVRKTVCGSSMNNSHAGEEFGVSAKTSSSYFCRSFSIRLTVRLLAETACLGKGKSKDPCHYCTLPIASLCCKHSARIFVVACLSCFHSLIHNSKRGGIRSSLLLVLFRRRRSRRGRPCSSRHTSSCSLRRLGPWSMACRPTLVRECWTSIACQAARLPPVSDQIGKTDWTHDENWK